jgi:transcriptional regulator with XRE-family HTH domain
MRRATPQDQAFKRKVAEEFKRVVEEQAAKRKSVEWVGGVLGVTRQAVYKYLNGEAIPGLRVLERARSRFGVRLSYGELGDRYVRAKRDERQLELFPIEKACKEQIEIKRFVPKGESAAELLIRIDFSKTA